MKFREVVPDSNMSEEEREARWALWRAGDLSWKLKGKQIEIYNDLIDQSKDVSTILCSRRFGKSTATLVAEIEICLQTPFAIVKHACPTQKMVKEMMYPALRVIFHDSPPELELDKLWKESEGKLIFPNGSMLVIAGTDGNNADNLRGAYAHFVTADEAGFMDDLDYVIKSILLPQTDTTGGKLALLSTPNFYNPNHEFHTEYVFPYESSGNLVKFNIYDSPMLDDNERKKIIARFKKGEKDPKFLCEYMVEVPRSTETTIVPEFYEHKNDILFDESDRNLENPEESLYPEKPEFCDFYVSGDIGVNDLTIFIFGYYNFLTAQLVILDEWVMNGMEMSTLTIAEGIKAKEEKWFRSSYMDQRLEPFKRVMDNNLQMITDLKKLHGLSFKATKKDNKVAQINNLRVFISEGRLKIHRRCKNLIYHLTSGQWKQTKSSKNEFDHLDESIDGELPANHCDGIDALNYLVRNLDQNRNPFPYAPLQISENQHISQAAREAIEDKRSRKSIMQTIFGLKGKK